MSVAFLTTRNSALREDKLFFYMIGSEFREVVPIIDTVMHFLI